MGKPEHPVASNWRRPIPSEDPAVGRLTAMVTALTSELTMLRERLDTFERLADKAGVVLRQDIETYIPTQEEAAERDAQRRRQIAKVFRPLRDDAEQDARQAAKEDAR